MKRMISILVTLLALIVFSASALAMEGEYTWRERSIEVTKAEKNPMLVPADMGRDEYAVAIYITVDKSLWQNDALRSELYAEAQLVDAQGTAYSPGAMMTGSDTPLLILTFCVPQAVDMESLSFTAGENAADSGNAANTAETQAAPVEIATKNGDMIVLTPLEAGAFQLQEDDVIVHTRIGTTVHNSGSQFTAGSGLRLVNMRQTKQYGMPMVAFTYETANDFDQTADAIGEIGKTATLTLNRMEYSVQVAWITEQMACYIFDCPELPTGAARFAVRDGVLAIEP